MKNIIFRDVDIKDREFILKAHEEINNLSGINNNSFKDRIDKDLFEEKFCKSIIAEIDDNIIWMILYCYIYWANFWRWIYISQAYVKEEYRWQWIYKQLIEELKRVVREKHFNFKEYEIPFVESIEFIDELPRTEADKIDYNLLEEMAENGEKNKTYRKTKQ